MKLQIALDVDEKKALKICETVKQYIDIIELGTPLVKNSGLKVVKKFKKFKKPIVADLKTMDTGELEAEIAFKAGADISTVLGCADDSTIKGAIKAARKHKKKIVVDLISIKNIKKRVQEIKKLKPNYFCVHTGVDMQHTGKNPLKNLQKISKVKNIKISVAGGVNIKNIDKVMKYKPEIIIIGSAITNAKNPKEVARKIKEKIK